MVDAVGCIALDVLGTTIAIGHGEKVSVIDQSTICACDSRLPYVLSIGVFQPYGRTSGFSQTHPHSTILKKNYPPLPPVLCTLCGRGAYFWSHILNMALCKPSHTP